MADPFAVKDCTLISIAGEEVDNLRELSDRVKSIHPGFLHYSRLAERLVILDPGHRKDLEALCREMADVIDERLAESVFLRARSWKTSPRFFRSCPKSIFLRHFGIHTTWYLQSHFVWLKHCMSLMKPPFS
jgi:hypothetical protein